MTTPQQAATELLRRRRARRSLVDYARYISVPGAPANEENDDSEDFKPVETTLARHHEIILDATQRCIAKHRGRTMLFLPPGSAKSTYATVVSTTWAMGVNPNFKAITVSYGTDLARKFGRRMRSIAKQPAFEMLFGCGLSPESAAADEWALTNGSEFMGGGILSGITGNRADFIAIDDPIKGRQEADSEATRSSTIAAYEDDVLTRLKPSGSVMMTLTRWHEGDLAGSILPANWNGESGMIECRDGETWEVICIPAQAERLDDLLGRQVGEYIWPEWFTEDHWRPFKLKPRTWSALYQQRPAPDTGDYFRKDWIHEVDNIPPIGTLRIYGGSDYAVTQNGGDYTVHAIVGVDPQSRLYLLDLWRAQASTDKWIDAFCDLVKKWKPIGWAEETGQIKSGVGPFLIRSMLEKGAYVAREQFPTRGDKAIRAQSFRGRIASTGLYIPSDADWKSDLISEMMSFPVGVHDDQCLIGTTMVDTIHGKRPIMDVVPGNYVITPDGPKRVAASRMTNMSAEVYDVTLSDGRTITATGNHPVFVRGKGFVNVDALCIMDAVALKGEHLCSEDRQRLRLSSIMATDTADIQTASTHTTSDISMPQSQGVVSFIGISGKMQTARSLAATTFITAMGTGITTIYPTLNAFPRKSIAISIPWLAKPWSAIKSIWDRFGLSPANGIDQKRAVSGTAKRPWNRGRERWLPESFASAAAPSHLLTSLRGHASALAPALSVIAIRKRNERLPVYNLKVEDCPMFYANGILTHNCDALGLVGQLLDRMISGKAEEHETVRPQPKRGQIVPPPVYMPTGGKIKL